MLPRKIGFAMSSTSTRWLFLSLLFGLCAFSCHAQIIQSARYEVSVDRRESNYEIIPAEQRGLFVLSRLLVGQTEQLEITSLDTAFRQTWKGYLPLTKGSMLISKRAAYNQLYILQRNLPLSRNDLSVIVVSKDSAKYTQYFIRNYIPITTTEFQILPDAIIIGGYYNRVPVVIYYSFITRKSRILPGLLNESGELTQVKVYPDGTFDVLISAKNLNGIQTIWIKNYDASGELLRNYSLEPEGNKNLIFARSLKINQDMHVVAGVYGARNSEYSRGLFIASIDPAGIQQMRYYNFADLENFFKYLKAKREQRIKARIQRRKIKGKRIRFSYRFLVHEIVPYQEQYVLLGEAFYPKYITFDRGFYSGFFNPHTLGNGSSFTRDGRIFDGYYYTHAAVMGFDKDGNVIWDNSFEINDVKTFTLEQFVKLETQSDKIALLYVYDNELRTKIIKGNEVLEGKATEPIKTRSDSEIIDRENSNVTRLDYWYGKYFYAYGVQEITNSRSGKRKVFFINKVSYQ